MSTAVKRKYRSGMTLKERLYDMSEMQEDGCRTCTAATTSTRIVRKKLWSV